MLGGKRTFDFLDNNPFVEFHPNDYVNDPFVISQNEKMVAVNSALSVDITGQVCADSIGRDIYSGFGGQVDFIRGAARSKGGKPIIAMPSTARGGEGVAHLRRACRGLRRSHDPGRRALRRHRVRGGVAVREEPEGAGRRS